MTLKYEITFPLQDIDVIQKYLIIGNRTLTKTILEKITELFNDDNIKVEDLTKGKYTTIRNLQMF